MKLLAVLAVTLSLTGCDALIPRVEQGSTLPMFQTQRSGDIRQHHDFREGYGHGCWEKRSGQPSAKPWSYTYNPIYKYGYDEGYKACKSP